MIKEIVQTIIDTYELVSPLLARFQSGEAETLNKAREVIEPIYRKMVSKAIGEGLNGVTLDAEFASPYLELMSLALREAGLTEVSK